VNFTPLAVLLIGLYLGFWTGAVVAACMIRNQNEKPQFRLINRDELTKANGVMRPFSIEETARIRRAELQMMGGTRAIRVRQKADGIGIVAEIRNQ
jgi:hypothetical protein